MSKVRHSKKYRRSAVSPQSKFSNVYTSKIVTGPQNVVIKKDDDILHSLFLLRVQHSWMSQVRRSPNFRMFTAVSLFQVSKMSSFILKVIVYNKHRKDTHLPQSPFVVNFFRWRHFALPSVLTTSPTYSNNKWLKRANFYSIFDKEKAE